MEELKYMPQRTRKERDAVAAMAQEPEAEEKEDHFMEWLVMTLCGLLGLSTGMLIAMFSALL